MIRTLLALEFLVAIEVWLTFWSEVAGQYDLDLMFWAWKFGLILAAAALTVGLTAELLSAAPRRFSRRGGIYVAGLLLVMLAAGAVTYYTWLNEPQDDDGGDDPAAVHTTELYLTPTPFIHRQPGSQPGSEDKARGCCQSLETPPA